MTIDKKQMEQIKKYNPYEEMQGVESIRYKADNLMDQYVMQALSEAYQKYTPQQIIEKLK
jgi:ABC-type transporter lipoprotein component MlaA